MNCYDELVYASAEERDALAAGDDKRGSLVNADFHLEVLRASGNEVLFALMAPLQSQIQRLFRRTITTISRELTEDHTTLLDAVRDQDAGRAAEIARRHVEETRDLSITVAD